MKMRRIRGAFQDKCLSVSPNEVFCTNNNKDVQIQPCMLVVWLIMALIYLLSQNNNWVLWASQEESSSGH